MYCKWVNTLCKTMATSDYHERKKSSSKHRANLVINFSKIHACVQPLSYKVSFMQVYFDKKFVYFIIQQSSQLMCIHVHVHQHLRECMYV